MVDVRQTGIPESFENERLENIPSARDPWVILEQTPGMVMDRQNVGGNESGQQSSFHQPRHRHGDQNTWNYDGVNITDNAATGSTPMYFDFGAFEEMSISTGGKTRTCRPPARASTSSSSKAPTSSRVRPSFTATTRLSVGQHHARAAGQGCRSRRSHQDIFSDYGFDIGGPILKDRAWIWGDYGVQDIHKGAVGFLTPGCDDPDDENCLQDDPTLLRNANIKFNFQLTPNNKFNFLWAYNNKTRETRGASDTRPLETTWKQRGPVHIYKFEDTHIVNDSFLLHRSFRLRRRRFRPLLQTTASLRDVQVELRPRHRQLRTSPTSTTRPRPAELHRSTSTATTS